MNPNEIILDRIYEIENKIYRLRKIQDDTGNVVIYKSLERQIHDLECLKPLSERLLTKEMLQ